MTCSRSSKAWAQNVQYAIDVMGGPVAIGTDFNGGAGHLTPRFGDDACFDNDFQRTLELAENKRLAYPFTIGGFGTFDRSRRG